MTVAHRIHGYTPRPTTPMDEAIFRDWGVDPGVLRGHLATHIRDVGLKKNDWGEDRVMRVTHQAERILDNAAERNHSPVAVADELHVLLERLGVRGE